MDSLTDRPPDLTASELLAWRLGYSKGVAKYLKDNGTPAMSGPKPEKDSAEYPVWRADLHERTVAFREGAHGIAQPYATRSLAAYRKRAGIVVVTPAPKRAPRKVTTKVSAEAERTIRIAVASARGNRSLAVYDAALDVILHALGISQTSQGVEAA